MPIRKGGAGVSNRFSGWRCTPSHRPPVRTPLDKNEQPSDPSPSNSGAGDWVAALVVQNGNSPLTPRYPRGPGKSG